MCPAFASSETFLLSFFLLLISDMLRLADSGFGAWDFGFFEAAFLPFHVNRREKNQVDEEDGALLHMHNINDKNLGKYTGKRQLDNLWSLLLFHSRYDSPSSVRFGSGSTKSNGYHFAFMMDGWMDGWDDPSPK